MKNAFTSAAWLCALIFAVPQWLVLAVVRLALIVLGLPVVAVALFSTRSGISLSDSRQIVNLPRWSWLFGNDFDGLDGDGRGWWAANCDALVLFGLLPALRAIGLPLPALQVTSWLARWWWAAMRNPVNNMRLLPVFSCPVSDCVIACLGKAVVEDSPGMGGFQFVVARRPSGLARWPGLYFVHQWSTARAFVLRLGFKIKPAHAGVTGEPAKGMTYKLNPAKGI